MCTEQPEQETPSISSKLRFSLKDSKRQASQMIVSPGGCLGATVDCLGRIILFDTGRLLALRMWKVRSPACIISRLENSIYNTLTSTALKEYMFPVKKRSACI